MKVQYYPIDLAHALGVGEIQEMHVDVDKNGVPVLRITCSKKPAEDEYVTVRVGGKQEAQKKEPKRPTPAPAPGLAVRILSAIAHGVWRGISYLAGVISRWIKKKTKPEWME